MSENLNSRYSFMSPIGKDLSVDSDTKSEGSTRTRKVGTASHSKTVNIGHAFSFQKGMSLRECLVDIVSVDQKAIGDSDKILSTDQLIFGFSSVSKAGLIQ